MTARASSRALAASDGRLWADQPGATLRWVLNHVVPALMYFRSLVNHANLDAYNFTIDAHSEAGHRGRANPPRGEPIRQAAQITMYATNPNYSGALSEQRLREFVQDAADSLN